MSMKTHKIDSIAELCDHAIQAARMARRAQRRFTYEKRRLKSDKSVLTEVDLRVERGERLRRAGDQ